MRQNDEALVDCSGAMSSMPYLACHQTSKLPAQDSSAGVPQFLVTMLVDARQKTMQSLSLTQNNTTASRQNILFPPAQGPLSLPVSVYSPSAVAASTVTFQRTGQGNSAMMGAQESQRNNQLSSLAKD